MIHILFLIIISLAIYFSNLFFIKKKFLLNSTGDPHQSFISKTKVPLSGGVFLIVASNPPPFSNDKEKVP